MFDAQKKIGDWWERRTPKQKGMVICGVVLIVGLGLFYGR